jgi:hypothetical protein
MHREEEQRELTELEAALRRLRPLAAGVDRDELMFNAGRASAGTHAGLHLSATVLVAVFAALAGAGTVWVTARPSQQAVVQVPAQKLALRIVELSPALPSAKAPESWTGTGDYIKLRDRVLAEGVDALPALRTSSGISSGASMEDLYREMGIQRLRPFIPERSSPSERRG